MSTPSPLGSDGIPYVFDSFLLAGVADAAEFDEALFEGELSLPSRTGLNPIGHEEKLPLDNAIVDFVNK